MDKISSNKKNNNKNTRLEVMNIILVLMDKYMNDNKDHTWSLGNKKLWDHWFFLKRTCEFENGKFVLLLIRSFTFLLLVSQWKITLRFFFIEEKNNFFQ